VKGQTLLSERIEQLVCAGRSWICVHQGVGGEGLGINEEVGMEGGFLDI